MYLPLEIVNHILSYRPRHPIFSLEDYHFGLLHIEFLKNRINKIHQGILEMSADDMQYAYDPFDFAYDLNSIMSAEVDLQKPYKVILFYYY